MKLPLTELRNSGPCSRPVLSYWGSCTARSGRGQGSSQGSFVGSSQGSFVGSRLSYDPPYGSEAAGRTPHRGVVAPGGLSKEGGSSIAVSSAMAAAAAGLLEVRGSWSAGAGMRITKREHTIWWVPLSIGSSLHLSLADNSFVWIAKPRNVRSSSSAWRWWPPPNRAGGKPG